MFIRKQLKDIDILNLKKQELVTEEPTVFELGYVKQTVWDEFKEKMKDFFGEDHIEICESMHEDDIFYENGEFLNCIEMRRL